MGGNPIGRVLVFLIQEKKLECRLNEMNYHCYLFRFMDRSVPDDGCGGGSAHTPAHTIRL